MRDQGSELRARKVDGAARSGSPPARRPPSAGSLLGAYDGSFPRGRRLDAAEERELVRRAAEGDAAASARLVEANFPLLVQTALRFRRRTVPLEDLLGEACAGLLEAVPRFDPERGFRFMTYAIWWVRRALVRALASQSRTVRIPRHRAAADQAAGTAASAWPREISLSEEPQAGGLPGLAEQLPAETSDPDEGLALEQRGRALHQALAGLPERERFILSQRFGLVDDERRTLRSIALELGLTKERVRQLEGQALGRLERELRTSRAFA